jgi:hypothetical protein
MFLDATELLDLHTHNDTWIAFPPGALVSRMHAESGPFAMDVEGPNTDPVYLKADDDWIQLQPTGGLKLFFDYNCNGEIKPIKAWLKFDADTTQDGPPSISIDMPASVSCSTNVAFDAIVTDPDADAGTVRFEVDGVLLDTSVTTITVDQTHEIVATRSRSLRFSRHPLNHRGSRCTASCLRQTGQRGTRPSSRRWARARFHFERCRDRQPSRVGPDRPGCSARRWCASLVPWPTPQKSWRTG